MLDVSQLSIEIDGKQIVDKSSFFVPRGKITSIIGESGSGKSMTVSALLGILPPGAKATGQATFNGKNLITVSNKEMAKYGNRIYLRFSKMQRIALIRP